jgi:hypothetical protein
MKNKMKILEDKMKGTDPNQLRTVVENLERVRRRRKF